jgi:hypothetical protein
MDNKVLWADQQPFRQDPEAGFVSEETKAIREYSAQYIKQFLKEQGYAQVNSEALLDTFSENPALVNMAVDGVFSKIRKEQGGQEQFEEFLSVKGGEEKFKERVKSKLVSMANIAQYSSSNTYAALANVVVERANKTGMFFENPASFLDTEADGNVLNQEMLQDQDRFVEVFDSSITQFKEELAAKHNMGALDVQDPKTFARYYHIYTQAGPEALTEIINSFGRTDIEQGVVFSKYKKTLAEAEEIANQVNVSKVAKRTDLTSNNFTDNFRSGKYDVEKENVSASGNWMDVVSGEDYMYNEFGDKYQEQVFGLAEQVIKGEAEFGLEDLYNTVATYAAVQGSYSDGERNKASDDVYRFNYKDAPDEVRMAFDIISTSSVSNKDIKIYGDGEFGLVFNRLEALQEEHRREVGQRGVVADSVASFGRAFLDGAVVGFFGEYVPRMLGFDETAENVRDWRDTNIAQTTAGFWSSMAGNVAGIGASMFLGGTGAISAGTKGGKLAVGFLKGQKAVEGVAKVARTANDTAKAVKAGAAVTTASRLSKVMPWAKSGKGAQYVEGIKNFSEKVLGFNGRLAVGSALYQGVGYAAKGDAMADETMVGSGMVDMAGHAIMDDYDSDYEADFKKMSTFEQYVYDTIGNEIFGAALSAGLYALGLGARGLVKGKPIRKIKAKVSKTDHSNIKDMPSATAGNQEKLAQDFEFLGKELEKIVDGESNFIDNLSGEYKTKLKEAIDILSDQEFDEKVVTNFKESIDQFASLNDRAFKALEDQGLDLSNPRVRSRANEMIDNLSFSLAKNVNDYLSEPARVKLVSRLREIYSKGEASDLYVMRDGKRALDMTKEEATKYAYKYGGKVYQNGSNYRVQVVEDNAFIHDILASLDYDKVAMNRSTAEEAFLTFNRVSTSSKLDDEQALVYFNEYYGSTLGKDKDLVLGFTPKGVEVFDGSAMKILDWGESGLKNPFEANTKVKAGQAIEKVAFSNDELDDVIGMGVDYYDAAIRNDMGFKKQLNDMTNYAEKQIEKAIDEAIEKSTDVVNDKSFNSNLNSLIEQYHIVKRVKEGKKVTPASVSKEIERIQNKLLKKIDAANAKKKTSERSQGAIANKNTDHAVDNDVRSLLRMSDDEVGKGFDGNDQQVMVGKQTQSMFGYDPQAVESMLKEGVDKAVNQVRTLVTRLGIGPDTQVGKLFGGENAFRLRFPNSSKSVADKGMNETFSINTGKLYEVYADDDVPSFAIATSSRKRNDISNRQSLMRIRQDSKGDWQFNSNLAYLDSNKTLDTNTGKLKRYNLVEKTENGGVIFEVDPNGAYHLNVQNPMNKIDMGNRYDRAGIVDMVFRKNRDAVAHDPELNRVEIFAGEQVYDEAFNPIIEPSGTAKNEKTIQEIYQRDYDASTKDLTPDQKQLNKEVHEAIDRIDSNFEIKDEVLGKGGAEKTLFKNKLQVKKAHEIYLKEKKLPADTDFYGARLAKDVSAIVTKGFNKHPVVGIVIKDRMFSYSVGTRKNPEGFEAMVKRVPWLKEVMDKKTYERMQERIFDIKDKAEVGELKYKKPVREKRGTVKETNAIREGKDMDEVAPTTETPNPKEEATPTETNIVDENVNEVSNTISDVEQAVEFVHHREKFEKTKPKLKVMKSKNELITNRFGSKSKKSNEPNPYDTMTEDDLKALSNDLGVDIEEMKRAMQGESGPDISSFRDVLEKAMPSDDWLDAASNFDPVRKQELVDSMLDDFEDLIEARGKDLKNTELVNKIKQKAEANKLDPTSIDIAQSYANAKIDQSKKKALSDFMHFLSAYTDPGEMIANIPAPFRTMMHNGKYVVVENIDTANNQIHFRYLKDIANEKKATPDTVTNAEWLQNDPNKKLKVRDFSMDGGFSMGRAMRSEATSTPIEKVTMTTEEVNNTMKTMLIQEGVVGAAVPDLTRMNPW